MQEAAALVALLDRIASEDTDPSPEVLLLVGIDAEGWGLVWLFWLPEAAAGLLSGWKEAA